MNELDKFLKSKPTIRRVIDFIDSRHFDRVKEAKISVKWLKKKLGENFSEFLILYGDPDKRGNYINVRNQWQLLLIKKDVRIKNKFIFKCKIETKAIFRIIKELEWIIEEIKQNSCAGGSNEEDSIFSWNIDKIKE